MEDWEIFAMFVKRLNRQYYEKDRNHLRNLPADSIVMQSGITKKGKYYGKCSD